MDLKYKKIKVFVSENKNFKNALKSYKNSGKDECRTSDTICLEFSGLITHINLKIHQQT